MSTDGSSTQGELERQRGPTVEKGAEEEKIQNEPQAKPAWTPSPPPDGGFTAWSVLAGSWCVLFCSFGWINSKLFAPFLRICQVHNTNQSSGVGTFQNYYESDLLKQYSSSTIAWIPSLQIFFMFAMVGCNQVINTLLNTDISTPLGSHHRPTLR